MRLLLDTHMALWFTSGDPRLSAAARAAYLDPGNDVLFSVVSAWEIAIKAKKGNQLKLIGAGETPETFVKRRILRPGIRVLDVQLQHVLHTYDLPPLHGDPFDRLLIAQAAVEGATLLSADRAFPQYGLPVIA